MKLSSVFTASLAIGVVYFASYVNSTPATHDIRSVPNPTYQDRNIKDKSTLEYLADQGIYNFFQ